MRDSTTGYTLVMSHFRYGRTFEIAEAKKWFKAAGYRETSAQPACSDLSQMGFLRFFGDNTFRFREPMTPEALAAARAAMKERRTVKRELDA